MRYTAIAVTYSLKSAQSPNWTSVFSDHIDNIRMGHNNQNNHMNKLPPNTGEREGSKSCPQDRAR
jgi:hypothetical protein